MRNVVILTGRLTADPELRQTPAGKFVCSFNIAVQRDRSPEETDFIKVEAWSNTAQFCSKYFHKGQLVDILGTLRSNKWEDANKSIHNERTVLIKEISFAPTNNRKPQEEEQKNDFDNPFASHGMEDFTEADADDLPY